MYTPRPPRVCKVPLFSHPSCRVAYIDVVEETLRRRKITEVILNFVSMCKKKFSAHFQLMFQLLKLLLLVGFVVVLVVVFQFLNLTIGDCFASLFAFFPSGTGEA
ncbi:hypothetical protein QVD17_37314 [Tagetes erecta]|uniref:Transmembrane protein n=1 Tax=Tagetes erecta TaxID=13708 RepID=A0AAD8NCL9_TARER|nr:hypothetical protein QVD17_37314 [Tagetes erecta]